MTPQRAREIIEDQHKDDFSAATLLEAEGILGGQEANSDTVETFTPTPGSLSTDPTTATAQLAIRVERAEKAQAGQHTINATSFETRVQRFEAIAICFQDMGADEITAREKAADFIDAIQDYNLAQRVVCEIAIATHQDDEGTLNGPNGTLPQCEQRRRSNLLGLNRKAQS